MIDAAAAPYPNPTSSIRTGTLTAGADIFKSCDSESKVDIAAWKPSSESLGSSSSKSSARRTCCLSFFGLGGNFPFGQSDCK